MLYIAICDDQADQIQKIRTAAETYFLTRNERVEYQTFSNAFAFTDAIDRGSIFDIVLLDVCMPGMLGTEVAQHLRDAHSRAEMEQAADWYLEKITDAPEFGPAAKH